MKKLTAEIARMNICHLRDFHENPKIGLSMREELLLQALEIALPVLEQQGGWIRCSERMPEDGQWKQVWDGVSVVIAYFYKDYGHFVRDNGDELYRVTHWQPLTSPPQPQSSTTPQIGNDGWIEWGGGICPVPVNKWVEIRMRNGLIDSGFADDIRWGSAKPPRESERNDIIAYRVIENDGRQS